MKKYFYQLKIGEQFDGEHYHSGWDFLKKSFFFGRIAHIKFTYSKQLKFFYLPWTVVTTIEPNPNCEKDCPCKNF